jgi:hypothetical protein
MSISVVFNGRLDKLCNKTDMHFLAGEYDVICTEKIIIDLGYLLD